MQLAGTAGHAAPGYTPRALLVKKYPIHLWLHEGQLQVLVTTTLKKDKCWAWQHEPSLVLPRPAAQCAAHALRPSTRKAAPQPLPRGHRAGTRFRLLLSGFLGAPSPSIGTVAIPGAARSLDPVDYMFAVT